jgi:hypothetical protein
MMLVVGRSGVTNRFRLVGIVLAEELEGGGGAWRNSMLLLLAGCCRCCWMLLMSEGLE